MLGHCPYGGKLWVRERWAPGRQSTLESPSEATYACFPDGSQKFRSGEYYPQGNDPLGPWPAKWRWYPSIHMPRWASRITLEVTNIRVERLQQITEEDAIAEGVDAVSVAAVPRQAVWSRRQDFAQFWDKINGKGSWKENAWVWVVSFGSSIEKSLLNQGG